jgi:hypothetical protein
MMYTNFGIKLLVVRFKNSWNNFGVKARIIDDRKLIHIKL